MYTYTCGYDNEDVYWEQGRTVGGVAIGVIQMGPALVPMVPGNMGNGTTFPFTVMWEVMEERAEMDMVVSTKPHPDVLKWIITAGKKLQKQGCRAVTGNCGYLANYQPEVAAALDIPVFLSSLLQVPTMLRSIKPDQKVGIVCASGKALGGAPALRNCGVDEANRSRIVIVGAENTSQMDNVLTEKGHINNVIFEREIVGLATDMVKQHPEVGAILLECTELPPYAWAVQKATRRPVFDFTTLVKWVYSGVIRQPFSGFM